MEITEPHNNKTSKEMTRPSMMISLEDDKTQEDIQSTVNQNLLNTKQDAQIQQPLQPKHTFPRKLATTGKWRQTHQVQFKINYQKDDNFS